MQPTSFQKRLLEIDSAPQTGKYRSSPARASRTSASHSWRTILCLLALTTLIVDTGSGLRPTSAAAAVTPGAPAAVTPGAPGAAWSLYVKTTHARWLHQAGCRQARQMGRSRSLRDAIVVLDFGRPVRRGRRHSDPWQGVSLFRRRGFIPLSAVLKASERYARGVWTCSRGHHDIHLRIAIGTTNWGPHVSFHHGRAWAAIVNLANDWAVERGYHGKLDFAGANDIELSWNGPRVTRGWVRGYESVARHPYYNYGSADACPPRGKCAGAWTLEDVWWVSWGAPHAWPLPEIYTPNRSQALQWFHLARYSYRRHGAFMRFMGVMSQHGACWRAKDPCRGMNNTPERAWQQLTRLLNRDPRTRQHIPWVTDIR
jgi:hypothetical protein